MTAATVAAVAVGVIATALADVRWLRVAQREHYLAGSVTRFALRWWRLGPNAVLGAAAVIGVVVSPLSPLPLIVGAAAIAVGPFRYPLLGRAPGPVAWTRRLKTVAALAGGVQLVVVVAGFLLGEGAPVTGLVALTVPLVIDAALRVLQPFEDVQAQAFVDAATKRLEDVKPLIVGITGSYGKTTTKLYAAHLIAGARSVVATPKSFNNRAGLSRAVNEHLAPGTEVFVAEMGTYGKGEIAAMCAWCPPRVAAITAIGPVHLERFGSEDAIVEAKSEIMQHAETVVLNIDDPRLAKLRDDAVRCSSIDENTDVCARIDGAMLRVSIDRELIAEVPAPDVVAGNVAVAVGIAVAVGVPRDVIALGLGNMPSIPNRRAETTLSTGATAIDDTFNSNPAGCRAALKMLARGVQRRVVVTPGMVELGPRQAEENEAFGELAARGATHLIIVGFTNRKALRAGTSRVPEGERAAVLVADQHETAVEWVRSHTGEGDLVLYENQLPDHYP